jgi:hypothetical protein
MILILFLIACSQTCETIAGCALMEVCVTCDQLECTETVEVLRTGESWRCTGMDRNQNGLDDCWDYAAREVCP